MLAPFVQTNLKSLLAEQISNRKMSFLFGVKRQKKGKKVVSKLVFMTLMSQISRSGQSGYLSLDKTFPAARKLLKNLIKLYL